MCTQCGQPLPPPPPKEEVPWLEEAPAGVLAPERPVPALPPVPSPPQTTHPGAVVSFVMGVVSWVALPVVGALVAIVAGHVARAQIRAAGGPGGRRLALAGLWLGYLQCVCCAGFLGHWAVLLLNGRLDERPVWALPVAPEGDEASSILDASTLEEDDGTWDEGEAPEMEDAPAVDLPSEEEGALETPTDRLDALRIREGLRWERVLIQGCYDERLQVHPHLSGRLEVELAVSPSGDLVRALVGPQSTLWDAPLWRCVLEQLWQFRFEVRPGAKADLVVRVPYVFKSDEP